MATATSSLAACLVEPQASQGNRLEALARYDILDTPAEAIFDRIARLIQLTFDTPMAIVSLVDGHRQWYKAAIGMAVDEVPLSDTFCRYILLDSNPLFIPDARLDQRVADNAMVTGAPHIRFYAGAPLQTVDGHTIGTICAIGPDPRQVGTRERQILVELAAMAMDAMEMRRLATVDHLTGAATRRAFDAAGKPMFERAKSEGLPLSCITFDLDHFKTINDTFGHAAGDLVLKHVAAACQNGVGDTEILARVGGEEFAVLLPATGELGALARAERLRATIQDLLIPVNGRPVRITASFGVATLEPGNVNLDSLLAAADSALYRAKSSGRNRITSWNGTQATPEALPDTRRRVLKAGRISYRDGDFTVDCTVRSLSGEGAGMDVSDSRDIPGRFRLTIASDRFDRTCHIIARGPRHIEVEFD